MNVLRRKIGMLFQSSALFDSMTVAENIAFMLDQHTDLDKQERRKVVDEKLSLVDLEGIQDLRPAELSGGMRKRVGLARALAFDPEVIFTMNLQPGLTRLPVPKSINLLEISTKGCKLPPLWLHMICTVPSVSQPEWL